MEIRSECYGCLERLVDLTVGLATSASGLQEQARQAALAIIAREFGPKAIPARLANIFHRSIREITGNTDPFASRKEAETAFLADLYRKIAPSYGDDLESLLKLAVLGNAIDFFRDADEVRTEILAGVDFEVSHLPQFQEMLTEKPGLLLYLADNAGEQYFDRPLVEHLRRLGWQVLYVVKGGPIQNDLTREDLYASGLGEALEPVVDTGARTVGLVLEEVGDAFREIFFQARIILAKGMGHFETMSHLGDPRVFFLLQAKCGPVARALGVPRRGFVFQRGREVVGGGPGKKVGAKRGKGKKAKRKRNNL